jgi:hypothetical protein
MAIHMSLNSSVSDLGTPAVVGEARVGNDGDPYGAPEYDVGAPSDNLSYGFAEWDSDISSGFDTGAVPLQFTANQSGSSLILGGENGGSVTSGSGTSVVNEVAIRVDAQEPDMDAKLSGVVVSFYDDGKLTEQLNLGDLEAQTTDSQPVAEDLAVIDAPANTDQVVVTGTMDLSCSVPDEMPDVNDMFAQIDVS